MRTKESCAVRETLLSMPLQIFQAFRRQPYTVCSTKRARIRAWCPSRNSATVLKLPSANFSTARCLMKLNKR